MDFQAVADALQATGFTGFISLEQDKHPGDMRATCQRYLEIMRQCQISYKSALFMMTRIRFAMSPDVNTDPQLTGIVEVDETYVGGKPRVKFISKHGRGTSKTPVFAAVERKGRIHRRVITDVTASNLKSAMYEVIDRRARIMSDDFRLYWGVGKMFLTHETVNHSEKEYSRGDVHVNTAESSFALLKRGIHGIYQCQSSVFTAVRLASGFPLEQSEAQ